MLRLIVGYVKHPTDTWEDMYRRLKEKISAALERFPIHNWTDELRKRKTNFKNSIDASERNLLVQRISKWQPRDIKDDQLHQEPHRSRGRPRTKWFEYADAEAG